MDSSSALKSPSPSPTCKRLWKDSRRTSASSTSGPSRTAATTMEPTTRSCTSRAHGKHQRPSQPSKKASKPSNGKSPLPLLQTSLDRNVDTTYQSDLESYSRLYQTIGISLSSPLTRILDQPSWRDQYTNSAACRTTCWTKPHTDFSPKKPLNDASPLPHTNSVGW